MGQTPILVTGGAGYIGLHTVKYLFDHGYAPIVIDRIDPPCAVAHEWATFVRGDIADTALMIRLIKEHKPVAIIHMAASAEVGESATNPQKYYTNNVGGSLSLLSAMKECGLDKIVFSSTCAVYGQVETVPITESTPRLPINVYGRSKFMVELILEDFARSYGISFVAFRYFNACGADPSGEIGEMHDPETHLIPRALMACAGLIPHLDIYGDDYPTPDGTCLRDYIHVNDLARAHTLGVDYLLKNGASTFMNLGTGKGASVKEILDAAHKATERPVPIQIQKRRIGDSPILIADPEQARQILGFKTAYNDINETVLTAWNFHKRHWNIA